MGTRARQREAGGKKSSGGEQDRCTEEGRRAPGHRSTGERRSLSRDVGHPQEGKEGGVI
jgi:hypothetical protein